MYSRSLKVCCAAFALMLTTSPAWATSYNWKCYYPGVDKCGCLTNDCGACGYVYCCLNTCYGTYTGKGSGKVCNCSCPSTYETYYCKNFFCDPCWCICVKSSTYCVGKLGSCTYTCCGSAYKCNHGTGG